MNVNRQSISRDPGTTTFFCLAILLSVGAWLRLHNLGAPSIWADEMQAAFGASFPLDYLARWIMQVEVHPPTYHLLLKIFLFFGDADAILRLPSALCGIATIYLVYRLAAESQGEEAGLFAAALLTGNSLHIWISRQVRPYGVLVFLFSLSLLYFLRFLRDGTEKNFRRFLLANIPVVLFHLLSVLILAAQAVILLCTTLGRRTRARQLAVFCVASAVCFLPVSPVLLKTMLHRPDLTTPSPLGKVIQDTLGNLSGLFDFFQTGWTLPAYLVPLGLGLVRLGFVSRLSLGVTAAFVLTPLAIIILKHYAAYYFSTHLAFMLPVLLIPAGLGAAMACPFGKRAAGVLSVCLALALGASVFSKNGDKLYREDSLVVTWWNFGNFKAMARTLKDYATEKAMIVFNDPLLEKATDWYYRQEHRRSFMAAQGLTPQDKQATLHVMDIHDNFSGLSDVLERAKRGGNFLATSRAEKLHIATLSFPRFPITAIDSLPFTVTYTAEPDDVLARAYALKDVGLKTDGSRFLRAARYDSPGVVAYCLENTTRAPIDFIAVGVQFENTGKDNQISLEYAFDAGPPVRKLLTKGPDTRRFSYDTIQPPGEFRTLHLKVEMACRQITAQKVEGNLETLLVKSVFVALCDPQTQGPCSTGIMDWHNKMLQASYIAEYFLQSGPEQAFSVTDPSAATSHSEKAGWEILSPVSDDRPVLLHVNLRSAGQDLVFYPRVGGNSSIRAFQVGPDGAQNTIMTIPGIPGHWSPVAAQYPLPEIQGEMFIELKGKQAQLWRTQDTVLFSRDSYRVP